MCALIVFMMPILCKNFVNFGPLTPELIELICECMVRHAKKLAYLVKYVRIYWTDLLRISSLARWAKLPEGLYILIFILCNSNV